MASKDLRTLLCVTGLLFFGLQTAAAENDRQFVFTDEEGHLILHFAGIGPEGLSENQRTEVLNAEFSSMVHDHLRADLMFEAENVDEVWAMSTEQRISAALPESGPEFSATYIECRYQTCRILMQHATRWDIAEHQSRVETLRQTIAGLQEDMPGVFDPAYLIAAYDKIRFTPHIKVYLQRRWPDS